VGIIPVLLDRQGWYTDLNDCARISSLPELDQLLADGAVVAPSLGRGHASSWEVLDPYARWEPIFKLLELFQRLDQPLCPTLSKCAYVDV